MHFEKSLFLFTSHSFIKRQILIIHNKFLLLTLRLLQPRLFAQDLIRSKCLIQ